MQKCVSLSVKFAGTYFCHKTRSYTQGDGHKRNLNAWIATKQFLLMCDYCLKFVVNNSFLHLSFSVQWPKSNCLEFCPYTSIIVLALWKCIFYERDYQCSFDLHKFATRRHLNIYNLLTYLLCFMFPSWCCGCLVAHQLVCFKCHWGIRSFTYTHLG